MKLREFPNLSSRALAQMCGVSHELVQQLRPVALSKIDNAPATRTTSDGRQYPARRVVPEPQEPEPVIYRLARIVDATVYVVALVAVVVLIGVASLVILASLLKGAQHGRETR